MKFTGKERKMYVLALALLVAAIALACTWTMWDRPSSQTSQSAETPTPAPSGNARAGGDARFGGRGDAGGKRGTGRFARGDGAERGSGYGQHCCVLPGQLRLPRARHVQRSC